MLIALEWSNQGTPFVSHPKSIRYNSKHGLDFNIHQNVMCLLTVARDTYRVTSITAIERTAKPMVIDKLILSSVYIRQHRHGVNYPSYYSAAETNEHRVGVATYK